MSRTIAFGYLILGLALGAMAWGLAISGRNDRVVYGVVTVFGLGTLVLAIPALREGGRLPPAGSTMRTQTYGLLVAAIVHGALSPPFDPARACLALHLGIAGATGVALWRGRHAPDAPALPLLPELLLAGTLILVVGAELTLRGWAWYAPGPLFVQRDQDPAERLACLQPRPASIVDGQRVNADGFVDATFEHEEGRAAVLVIADRALALGTPAPVSAIAAARAARPDTTFWNASLPGLGPPEFVTVLERLGPTLRPQAVIVVLELGSDLRDLARTAPPWTSAALWLDRENLLLPVVGARIFERIAEHEALGDGRWQPLREAIDDAAALRAKLPWLDDPARQPPRATDAWLQRDARRSYEANRSALADGRVGEAVALATRLRAAAEAVGAGFGLVVLPARYQLDDALWRKIADGPADPWRDAPRTALLDGLRGHGVATLDLHAVLATAQPAANRPLTLFHRGDTALDEQGGRLAGQALAAFARSVLAQRRDGTRR
ncbi:MAG: hypothetical protein IT457_13460 [Planctomycetes bacterium]|nr:hypothetical protein [Planctomycetota bacterium]